MTAEIAAMIRAHYGEAVFASEIRLNVKITEAPSFGQSVITYAPASPGANAYRFLAKMLPREGEQTGVETKAF